MDAATVTLLGTAGTTTGGTLALILILLLILFPVFVKLWNWSKETGAQGALYAQLSEQVKQQKEDIEKLSKERNTLFEQVVDLKHKVEKFAYNEQVVEVLKKKLDDKDTIIAERDVKIASLLEDLLEMKDRVHNLELRLKADEVEWCEKCHYKREYKGE